MITSVSRALVGAAARRWPDESQTRREWLAELDFLASQRGSLRALSYAVGLAFARPAHAPAIGLTWRTTGTALFLLAGPAVLVLAVVTIAIAAMRLSPMVPPDLVPVALWSLAAAYLALAGLIGWGWGSRSVLTGPAALAATVAPSMVVSLILITEMSGQSWQSNELFAGFAVWAPSLAALIFFVARAAQRGYSFRALLASLFAWLVVLDAALIVEFWPRVGVESPGAPEGAVFVAEHAPMWFVCALTGQSFGVLNLYEQFQVGDDAYLMAYALPVVAVYTLTYTISAVKRGRVPTSPGSA
jgi:hypothetical protein